MKCETCDYYATSSYPLSNDFCAVDNNKFCHAKRTSLKNLTTLKLASCNEYSRCKREELADLVKTIIEEDLKPSFAERKLYVRSRFASYRAAFRLVEGNANVYIEFGHETKEGFVVSDIKLHILRRLDPGFGPVASQRIADVLKIRPAMVVEASRQIRRQLDIDYVLEWIAKRRKMDIVYL